MSDTSLPVAILFPNNLFCKRKLRNRMRLLSVFKLNTMQSSLTATKSRLSTKRNLKKNAKHLLSKREKSRKNMKRSKIIRPPKCWITSERKPSGNRRIPISWHRRKIISMKMSFLKRKSSNKSRTLRDFVTTSKMLKSPLSILLDSLGVLISPQN